MKKIKGVGNVIPKDMAGIKHPIVGYIGGIHKWLDLGLIKFAAESNPEKSFVFVGPLQRSINELDGIPNIYFLGQKPYQELPSYVSQFDLCVIPYLITDYTRNVYPTKINEYLLLGKPVLSTAIPEVEKFNERNGGILSIAGTREEFSASAAKILNEEASESLLERRAEIARREGSWKVKIEKMSALIEKAIMAKEGERSSNWKDSILKLYAHSKRRMVYAAGFLVILFFILFHTPLIWFIGSPLKLSDVPEKADAIVVLAGGVGESGRAGQGYEERVQYAVELYKKGYSPHLIFSSGFKYAIKEAEVMKALAVSLGVPEGSIILEENARNTYENIVLSNAILRKEHWKKAILISSPYHMLRTSLVCKKTAPDVRFIYTPPPHSIFYGNEGVVRMKHIVAIFHEYLGIAFYYFKGYI